MVDFKNWLLKLKVEKTYYEFIWKQIYENVKEDDYDSR